MSEVVDGLDLTELPKTGRPAKYPWKEWFDGQVRRLRIGRDYEGDMKSFRSSAYSAAKRHGVEIVTRVIEGDLHIQAIVTDDQDASPR